MVMHDVTKFADSVCLAEILADPSSVAAMPKEALRQGVAELSRLQADAGVLQSLMLARLISLESTEPTPSTSSSGDRLVTVDEAAALLGVTTKWLYHHWRDLPFAKKLGGKILRFSEQGIQRYIARRR